MCENDGCTVTTTKTKHSGTDDGDCTTPVICECGEIVTAAKSEHIYGEWKSNGNGTHTHKCTTAGCTIEETESCVGGAATCKKRAVCTVCDYQCKHAGGSATCVKKAVCTICSEEYGTYNMSIHEGLKSVAAKAATRTDEGNIEYWYCKDCDRYYIKQDGLVEIEKSQTVVAKITDTT